jgi:serpin B
MPSEMKKIITYPCFTAAFSILFALSGCTEKPDELLPTGPVTIELTSDQVKLVESGNSFSFDIFRNILEKAPGTTNMLISPLSISYALSMTLNGANGETRDSILHTLRLNNLTPEEINKSAGKLTKALLSVDKRVLIDIANSVWIEDNFAVKQSFLDILTGCYYAETETFDINDPGVLGRINGWIENKTNGLIKDMLDKIDPDAVMYLINAIYFKATWKYKFNRDETTEAPFYKSGGSAIDVPMMKQKVNLKVYHGNDFVAAELPYGQGNFVMDIIVPNEGKSIESVLPMIGDSVLSQLSFQPLTNDIILSMPRFKYGYKTELKDILSGMGMEIAFNETADFSNISSVRPLSINRVLHQAFIQADEEGTEAAAATAVEIIVTSAPIPREIKADHPFMYIIRETTTNAILFMGLVADPLSS